SRATRSSVLHLVIRGRSQTLPYPNRSKTGATPGKPAESAEEPGKRRAGGRGFSAISAISAALRGLRVHCLWFRYQSSKSQYPFANDFQSPSRSARRSDPTGSTVFELDASGLNLRKSAKSADYPLGCLGPGSST